MLDDPAPTRKVKADVDVDDVSPGKEGQECEQNRRSEPGSARLERLGRLFHGAPSEVARRRRDVRIDYPPDEPCRILVCG